MRKPTTRSPIAWGSLDAPLQILSVFYDRRSLTLLLNNVVTTWFPIDSGMLQGDSVATLLFNICIEPLLVLLEERGIPTQGYVDNVSLEWTLQLHWEPVWSSFVLLRAISSLMGMKPRFVKGVPFGLQRKGTLLPQH